MFATSPICRQLICQLLMATIAVLPVLHLASNSRPIGKRRRQERYAVAMVADESARRGDGNSDDALVGRLADTVKFWSPALSAGYTSRLAAALTAAREVFCRLAGPVLQAGFVRINV